MLLFDGSRGLIKLDKKCFFLYFYLSEWLTFRKVVLIKIFFPCPWFMSAAKIKLNIVTCKVAQGRTVNTVDKGKKHCITDC